MKEPNQEIIAQLRKAILSLQGLKAPAIPMLDDIGLQALGDAFPDRIFPTGSVHEFISAGPEQQTATCGFVSGVVGGLMRKGGASLWISDSPTIHPPALEAFGIRPEQMIFIHARGNKDALWVTEQALQCERLSGVICELTNLDFTSSRRLQLAVEKSRVTGFMLRKNVRKLQPTACVSRWFISPVVCARRDELPGLTFPRWKVELQKIIGGKPGSWIIEYNQHGFYVETQVVVASAVPLRKII